MFAKNFGARHPPSHKVGSKRPSSFIYDEDIDPEDIGIETEAEKQLKLLLKKQLNTSTSLKEQFSQHKKFITPSTFNSLTELVEGQCSLEKFKQIERNEEIHQELQRCGLSEEEIKDYLAFKAGQKNGLANPSIWEKYMADLENKVKKHNVDLLQPQEFTNVKKITRHEMDLEKTLYAGCADKSKLSSLVVVADNNLPANVDCAFKHVKDLSTKLLESIKKKKSKHPKRNKTVIPANLDRNEDKASVPYDPCIHHVTVPLEEKEVVEKRLSIEQIKSLPRFEKYSIGEPNKVLYLKNLHPKVTINELRSLFGNFEDENKCPIQYKICTGRMKGQAFLHFNDAEVAEKALHFVNGYILREKPIIIEFGRKS